MQKNSKNDKNGFLAAYCPICNSFNKEANPHIIAEKEGAYLLYLRCSNCHAASLAAVAIHDLKPTQKGMIINIKAFEVIRIDLNADEITKFNQKIDQKSVLSTYKILNNKNFNLINYLQ